jgi:hypothetical protein
MSIDVVAEGPVIVLKLSPETVEYYSNEQNEDTELPDEQSKILFVFQARVEGIGISLISKEIDVINY